MVNVSTRSPSRAGKRGGVTGIKHATTKHLTRIITYLMAVNQEVNITRIKNDTGVCPQRLKDAMNWLVCNNLVVKRSCPKQHGTFYHINTTFCASCNRGFKRGGMI